MHKVHKDLPFLCDRKKLNKTSKLITSLEDKKEYFVYISSLKQDLNHRLKLKKVHAVIEFKQSAWMKSYIDKNTKLRSESKNTFEKDFFKLMNNAVFGKTMENLRKHREIKLVTSTCHEKKISIRP